jgi:hypothetical protein
MPARRTILNTACGALLALLLLAVVAWWLAGLTPRWYQPVAADNAAAMALGETAEYRLVEEFQRIRPVDEVWRLRIPEAAINAWLATRLRQWLAGRGGAWPPELGSPQVRITPAGITVGVSADAIGGRVGLLTLTPNIADGRLSFATAAGLGSLPIGIPSQFITPHLMAAAGTSDSLAFLATILQGDSMSAAVPLVDYRHVHIHTIALEPGACVIRASTRVDTN